MVSKVNLVFQKLSLSPLQLILFKSEQYQVEVMSGTTIKVCQKVS